MMESIRQDILEEADFKLRPRAREKTGHMKGDGGERMLQAGTRIETQKWKEFSILMEGADGQCD